MNGSGSGKYLVVAVVVLVIAGATIFHFSRSGPKPVPPPVIAVVPTPATTRASTTVPATKPHQPPRQYMDVVLVDHPKFPTTQPLSSPVSLNDAAILEFKDPIYLDSRGELWITRPESETTADVLLRANKQSTHVLRERVLYIHYWPDAKGTWRPNVIAPREDGSAEIISGTARKPIGSRRDYLWDRAFSRDNTIVVPTATGVSVLDLGATGSESHIELITAARAPSDVAIPEPIVLNLRNMLAWIPWDNGQPGGDVVARFADGAWKPIPKEAGIPDRVIYIVPYLDGTMLTITAGERNLAQLTRIIVDPPQVDEAALAELIGKLGDPDPQVRQDAEFQITSFGSGAWPMLERVLPDQQPEAKIRVQRLLRDKLRARLNQFTLLPGEFRTVGHLYDNGVVFYCDAGVSIPRVSRPDGEPEVFTPAWISLRPGRLPELLPGALTHDVDPNLATLTALADEWLLYDEAAGIHRLLGNHIEPLLPSKYSDWGYCVGIDQRARWIFRKSRKGTDTLILDPTLPDPTPKLPVWRQPANPKTAGWTRAGWPVVNSGESWLLQESRWEKLKDDEPFITALDESAATQPATVPTTNQASVPSAADSLGPPLLRLPDGTRYFDGESTITRVRPDGTKTVWPLPSEAVGTGDIWLIAAADRLFLFNQPGRVIRIREMPDGRVPFTVEATFTRKIPSVDHFTRIWRDPAGRIVLVWGEGNMSILFPTGRIPDAIANLMPAVELQEEDTEKLPGAN